VEEVNEYQLQISYRRYGTGKWWTNWCKKLI